MDITPVIGALITLAVFVVTAYLIPFLRGKIAENDWAELMRWVDIGVDAAEMIYKESGMGKFKKEYVRDFLSQHGYTVDEEEINAMIEASVLRLKREAA